MNPHIINPHKYKKISRNEKLKKDKKSIKNIKSGRYKKSSYNNVTSSSSNININKRVVRKNKKVTTKNRSSIFMTFIKVACLILVLVGIGYLSTFIIDMENNPILSVFGGSNNDVKLVSNYDLKIGVNNIDTEKNVLINELYKYSSRKLVTYDEEYNIVYDVAKKITKIDDKTYEIEVKDVSDISNIIHTVQKLKASNNNIYYKYLSNVSSLNVKDTNIIQVILNNSNPYFVYSLNFNIELKDANAEKQNTNLNKFNFLNNAGNITFNRNDQIGRDIVKSISFKNYSDGESLVSGFRNDEIDVFLTSSEEDMRLIGQHEYGVKKYRDGETYFLFGNKNSKLFNLKEVRKAIAYSLNRAEIAKEISSTFTEVIDIPYIYSNVGYKYDIYGAENALIAESWNKNSGIYNKVIEGDHVNLELNLLVNSDDVIKVNIAENIKQMLESVGIRINLNKLKENEISQKVSKGEYDIVLSSVYINSNPDISYLYDYININENVRSAIDKISTSGIEDIGSNIKNLNEILSSEIACIGIVARNTNVVYQKYITGFENISYMNIFKDIDKIGKIIQ